MPALDGTVKRRPGRPCTKGWRGAPILITPQGEMAEALEAYAPNPEGKAKIIWNLIAIALAHVAAPSTR